MASKAPLSAARETTASDAAPRRDAAQSAAVRALWVMLVVCSTWTVVQVVGALLSHSESLLSDALSMVVDDLAYAFNLLAACQPAHQLRIKLAAPALSAFLLLAITTYSVWSATVELEHGDADSVLGSYVLGFGAANLAMDVLMIMATLYRDELGAWWEPRCGGGEEARRLRTARARGGARIAMAGRAGAQEEVSPRDELNLYSALAHVLADTLRSATQVVVGALILAGYNAADCDAIGTLVISGVILLGAAKLIGEVVGSLLAWRRGLAGAPQPLDTPDD